MVIEVGEWNASLDAPSRSSIQLLLLDSLTGLEGRFFIRVKAYDDAGSLAFADSNSLRTSVHSRGVSGPCVHG